MSLIILKEEGKERETEQQQLNPNIALYTFGYAGGQHTHFFSYFKKKVGLKYQGWLDSSYMASHPNRLNLQKLWFEMNDFLRNIFCPQCVVK